MPNFETIDYEEKIRQLLAAIGKGDREAFDALIDVVGVELRKISAYRRRQQLQPPSLHTSDLVNEVVLKLIQMIDKGESGFPESKEHLLALASRMMRFTLIDHARRRMTTVSLDSGDSRSADDNDPVPILLSNWSPRELDTLLEIERALKEIARSGEVGKRRCEAAALRIFGGMNYRQIADELGIKDDTARRDCDTALARVREALAGGSRSQAAGA
jgi:RNA polymerase sigma factor (TIGR02999 family)